MTLPMFEMLKFLAILALYLLICLILLGAGTTEDHFPDEISTNLLSKIWLFLFIAMWFSAKIKKGKYDDEKW